MVQCYNGSGCTNAAAHKAFAVPSCKGFFLYGQADIQAVIEVVISAAGDRSE